MRAFERTTADDCVAAGVRLSIEHPSWPRCLPAQPVQAVGGGRLLATFPPSPAATGKP